MFHIKLKAVSCDVIKTELKRGDTAITYKKSLSSFEEGEYLGGLTLDGRKELFFKVIVGNAPIIKEKINTAEKQKKLHKWH